jgi:hypothetical protein
MRLSITIFPFNPVANRSDNNPPRVSNLLLPPETLCTLAHLNVS